MTRLKENDGNLGIIDNQLATEFLKDEKVRTLVGFSKFWLCPCVQRFTADPSPCQTKDQLSQQLGASWLQLSVIERIWPSFSI